MADLTTFIPVRRQPTGPGGDVQQRRRRRDGRHADGDRGRRRHPAAARAGGARAVITVSQVSAGRKNRLSWEIDGSEAALAWHSEAPEELWIGHRERPNELLLREAGDYPPGHAEGFPDTFKHLYRAVYRAVAAGGPPDEPDYPTFADGHDEAADRRRHRALARRAAVGDRRPGAPGGLNEARPADGGVPDADPRRDRRLGGGQRLRDARGRVLAGRRGRRAPLCGRLPHRRRHARRREGGRDRRRARAPRPAHLGARLLPEPAVARRRGARRRARAPAQGDRRRAQARGRHRRHVRRARPREEPARQPRRLPRGVAAARRPRGASTACGSRSRTAR